MADHIGPARTPAPAERRPSVHVLGACACGPGCSCGCQSGGACNCGGSCG